MRKRQWDSAIRPNGLERLVGVSHSISGNRLSVRTSDTRNDIRYSSDEYDEGSWAVTTRMSDRVLHMVIIFVGRCLLQN